MAVRGMEEAEMTATSGVEQDLLLLILTLHPLLSWELFS